MPAKVTLSIVEGPLKGKVFTFSGHDTFLFGRSADCHARLPDNDPSASRHQFLLEVAPPHAHLRDLGSLNGTLVNGVKYGGRGKGEPPDSGLRHANPEADLRHGDRIQVGLTVFEVQVEKGPVCCECGREIAESDREASAWLSGASLCVDCRRANAALVETARPEPPRCGRCGKDLASQFPGVRQASYTCGDCQDRSDADPAAALLRMMMEAADAGAKESAREIGGYEIVKEIGRGGMGAVYLGRHRNDGTTAAIKILLARVAVREEERRRFLREIDVLRGLDHPNCVKLFRLGSAGSGFYFVMEYCAGGSVTDLMKRRRGKLPVSEAAPIVLQALDGLIYLHSRGFVHRDIKPHNILLTAGEGDRAKLADFGFAKCFTEAGLSGLTMTGARAGTPAFMPREQVTQFKFVKPVTDVWSMGATFYHMLTGAFPHNFEREKDPLAVVLRDPVIPIREREPRLPAALAEAIDRSLATEVKSRFQSASEFRMALAGAM